MQIEGNPEIKPENFTAIAVYSDMEQTGSFACSDERINRLVENTRWSMKSNFLDLPTDCPTRERLGWTGDAQIFFHTGAYLMDTAAFFRKWLRDMEDGQYDNGLLPAVIPYQGVEICTAYLHLAMTTLSEIAGLLNENDYQKKCQKYADGARRAYEHLFVKSGTLDTDRQAKLVRPLALGMLRGAEKEKTQRRLVKAVENYDYCVGTGFLSTPFLLPVLTEAGVPETAYRMLENTKKPGWLGEVLDGATTIWENWEGNLSQNHYSPGAVCEWLFDMAAGIRVAGKNLLRIMPKPGGSLTEVRAEYMSPYGKVISGWKKTESGIAYEIVIPANTAAEIILPDGREEMVGAGTHTF